MKILPRLLPMLAVLAAAAPAAEKPSPAPKAEKKDVLAEFTWRHVGEPILTEVAVDGKNYLFAVDTGATYTVFDTSLRKKLGRPRQRFTVIIGNSSHQAPMYAATSEVSVNGIPLGKNARILCRDLETVRLASGRDIRGVLGMEFLRNYLLRLDYDRRKVQLLRPGTKPRKDWGRSIPVGSGGLQGVPYIPACIQGSGPRSFQVDTGFRGALMLSGVDANLALRGKRVETVMATAAGPQRTASGRVGIASLAGYALPNLFFSAGVESTVGLEMLSRFIVVMDFPRRRMYLRAGKRLGAPDPGYLTGLRIMLKDGKTLVHSVIAGSQAEKAGLESGDRILKCNGKDISTYSLAELRTLGAAGKVREMALEIRRKKDTRNVKLAVRDMVPVVALHPLQAAVLKNSAPDLEKYFTAGGKIEDVGKTKATALHTAAMLNRAELVTLLLKKGAKPASTNTGGFTPLHLAVSAGSAEAVKLLLGGGADVKTRSPGGLGNLHLAAIAGDPAVAGMLITAGADTERRSKDEATPLIYAVASGNLDVVKLLAARGASLKAKGRGGADVVQTAAGNGHADILEYLLDKDLGATSANDAGATALHWAALRGKTAAARLLLAKGADANAPTKTGAVPLHTAATNGFAEVTALLLKSGAKVNTATAKGDTPLHYAAIYGQAEVLKLLLDAGAKADARNKAGWSPLFLALSRNREESALRLLAGGADPLAKLAKMTTLHMAAGRASLELCKLLLAGKVPLEARDNIGNTALHNAVALGKQATAEFLIEKGADVNAANNRGQRPIDYARQGKKKTLVELLLKHGAKEKK